MRATPTPEVMIRIHGATTMSSLRSLSGARPKVGDDVYVYSKGLKGIGTYPSSFETPTGEDGSIGYSWLHGPWTNADDLRYVFWGPGGVRPCWVPEFGELLLLTMVVPAAIFGAGLAGLQLRFLLGPTRLWNLEVIVVIVVSFLSFSVRPLPALPRNDFLLLMWFVVYYGIARSIWIMLRGRDRRKFAVVVGLILFTLAAAFNFSSAEEARCNRFYAQGRARWAIENIVDAEQSYKGDAVLDVDRNGVGEYGTLGQVLGAGHLTKTLPERHRFMVVVSGDPSRDEKEFFVYATPTNHEGRFRFLPGRSLLVRAPRYREPLARMSFASDETRWVRCADAGGPREITRKEAQKWSSVATNWRSECGK